MGLAAVPATRTGTNAEWLFRFKTVVTVWGRYALVHRDRELHADGTRSVPATFFSQRKPYL